MSDEPSGLLSEGALRTGLSNLRDDALARVAFVGLGVLLGVLLGSLHWAGLFAGGAIAGVGQRTTLRGVAAGALAGLGVWLVSLGTLGLESAARPALGATTLIAVSLAIAVGYGAIGGTLRYLT